MASQFTIYASTDLAAPTLSGSAGSLITLLDAILLNGYGAKPAAGWSRPVATASNVTSYKPGAGSQMGVVINDNGPNVTSTFKEAWATGWESVAGVGAPVGTGSGQFPTPAQLLTTGHVVIRKSTTADGTTRAWIAFADSYSLYLFLASGDSAGQYRSFFFGDFFSMKGNTDAYRCLIAGGNLENSTTPLSVDQTQTPSNACTGHFTPRTYGGGGTSVAMCKVGDGSKASAVAQGLFGALQTPNGPDNAWYLSPVWVIEPGGSGSAIVRGRMRGLYQICHPISSFSDGQTFSGAGDYAGKTFQLVKQGEQSGIFCMETSATVETN